MRRCVSIFICAVLGMGMLISSSGCGVMVPPIPQSVSETEDVSSREESVSQDGEESSIPEKEESESSAESKVVSRQEIEDTFDYDSYKGEWVSISRIDARDAAYRGGGVFTIRSINNGKILFSLQYTSAAPDSYTAEVEGECAFFDGKGEYSFQDDGLGNAGVLKMELLEDGSVSVKAESSGTDNDGWGIFGASGIYYSTDAKAVYEGAPENQQAVMVETLGSSADITLKTWKNGKWDAVFSTGGTVGKSGITLSPSETSTATPEGVFRLGFTFSLEKPNTKLDYRPVTENIYWVDDAGSKYYNMWRETTTGKDWSSAEALYSQFTKGKMRHCIVMEFNGNGLTSDGVKPGAGSVIFFCGRAGELTPTNGDIYIQDSDMLKILSYLDKSKAPVIAVRSKGE